MQMKKERVLNQSEDEMQSLFLLEEHRLKTRVKLHAGVYRGERGVGGQAEAQGHAGTAVASPGLASALTQREGARRAHPTEHLCSKAPERSCVQSTQ